MCGIVGAIGFIDTSVQQKIHFMNELQEHRGPDGHGIWQNNSAEAEQGVIFGHRRLAIIDLSQDGHQPMLDKTSGNCITFNGEIYNYLSLRDELIAAGETFQTKTDTEVILVAYRYWGEKFIERLRGMFAFVLWDANKNEVFFYRDRLGIKPVYYYERQEKNKTTLLFSSELKTLLNSGFVAKKLDPVSLQSYIWNGFVASHEATLIRDIKILPPGYGMKVSASGEIISKQKFWQLPKHYLETKRDLAGVTNVFEETIEQHMMSDVPVGIFLSGGVDSSAVAAAAKSQADSQISTYNLSFDEAIYDEAKYARQVAKSLNTDHHEIRLTQSDFTQNFDKAFDSIDQPTFDGINTFFISKAIKDEGISVALAGTGGDELFGGYTSFKDIPKITSFGKFIGLMPESVSDFAANTVQKLIGLKYGSVPPQVRWGKMADLIGLRGNVIGAYQSSYSLFTQDFHKKLLRESNKTIKFGLGEGLQECLAESIDGCQPLEAISNLELNMFIQQRLMRDTDGASMATSLEVRVPLLDHVFIEAVAGLDSDERYQPLGKKQVLRNIASKYMDPEVFNRPKSGFVLPLDVWLKESFKQHINVIFSDFNLCHSIGLNPIAVSDLLTAYLQGNPGLYWSRIWSIYCLIRWCKGNEVTI